MKRTKRHKTQVTDTIVVSQKWRISSLKLMLILYKKFKRLRNMKTLCTLILKIKKKKYSCYLKKNLSPHHNSQWMVKKLPKEESRKVSSRGLLMWSPSKSRGKKRKEKMKWLSICLMSMLMISKNGRTCKKWEDQVSSDPKVCESWDWSS